MGGEQAATVLAPWAALTRAVGARRGRRRRRLREQYERQGYPYYSTARLWDDGVIDPVGDAATCWASASSWRRPCR